MKQRMINQNGFWKWVFKISLTISSVIGYIVTILIFIRFVIYPIFIIPKLTHDNLYVSKFNVPFNHVNEITADISTNIKDFYNKVLDSLKKENILFALGVLQGEIRYFPVHDSLGVVLQFNFDCGCPVEDSVMTCLLIPLDLDQLGAMDEYYIEHVPKKTYPTINLRKESIVHKIDNGPIIKP